jgi:hypothetical protein
MRLAGQHDLSPILWTWMQHKWEWEDGARTAGKNPADMPVLVEQYVVVGDQQAAMQAGELWRFGPKAFKGCMTFRARSKFSRKRMPKPRWTRS